MPIDQKAIKVEQASEVSAKLKVCMDILNDVTPLLNDKSGKANLNTLNIDDDLFQDFDLAKSRISYIADHVRRVQLKLRKA